ncbi:MAG: hypothetical protein R3C99_16940 [Pirellulaceae bacterium]
MKYQELIILLPCHSLEDFPTHHSGEDAEGLLAAWTALWHPALIAAVESMPTWYRVDTPPEQVANRLIVVPSVSAAELPTGFAQRVKDEGGRLIRRKTDRREIIEAALESLELDANACDPELVGDFLALAYAYLQIQLLTRQMRYASNLDETYFRNQIVAGAQAAMAGDSEEARRRLTACFDVLAQERDHFYSVDIYMVDITLVAPTTLASLVAELDAPTPTNLLMRGELLEQLTAEQPELAARLKRAVEAGEAAVIGGEAVERRLPLLSSESLLAELRRGQAVYEAHLGQPLKVYGRFRFGLTPMLASVLHKLDYDGALHASLESGSVPAGAQVKTRWEGADGAGIDALARTPLDASKPETFLSLAMKMGESMDMDHVATVCLAHWPGHSCVWLDDLRRVARYGNALGKFVTVDEYFRDTVYPGQNDRFEAHQYKSPYLKQEVIRKQPNPLSSWIRYWQLNARLQAAESLGTLAALLTKDGANDLAPLRDKIDRMTEPPTSESSGDSPNAAILEAIETEIEAVIQAGTAKLQKMFTKSGGAQENSYLVINPNSAVRRMAIDTPNLSYLPSVERPIYAAEETVSGKQAIVDVPSLGYVLVRGDAKAKRSRRVPPPLGEELMIRNEFMEVHFDGVTGAIRAVHDYKSRTNRMSQQLAFRLPVAKQRPGDAWQDPDERVQYSVMAADSVRVTSATTMIGEMTTSGRLLDREGQTLATYQQISRLHRGSRVLELDIELNPQTELGSDPWNSYFACRVAWNDESADVFRTVNNVRQPAGSKRFEAPLYAEVENGDERLTILTGGLPYHRRVGLRVIDSLLIVRGESARRFRLGIGLDVAYPMTEAMHFMSPGIVIPLTGVAANGPPSAWLLHLDAKNVATTHWSPLVEEGSIIGFRVRLQETAGRMARTKLSAFRPIAKARQVDFRGLPLGECQIKDGAASIELSANEWVEVELTFT